MSKRRRFFIFFASAGLMCFFIYFSLSVRPDDPLKKWGQWLPSNKVKAMILDRETATGIVPRQVLYNDQAKKTMECLNVSELEVYHHLRDASVKFSHEKTKVRQKPKTYYLTEEINKKEYFVVVAVTQKYSTVTEFGMLTPENNSCQ